MVGTVGEAAAMFDVCRHRSLCSSNYWVSISMTATTLGRADATPTVPSTLESPQGKLVYVYLAATREATVDALAADLGMRKLGLLTVLSTLEANGYVERDGPDTVLFAD
jgi:hypothetical protein